MWLFSVILEWNIISIVMRTFRFLLLSACCGWSVVTFAQRYELEEVKAGRYEVTNRLDARPDSGAVRVVAPYRHAVDSMMSPVLGESEVAMRADRPDFTMRSV